MTTTSLLCFHGREPAHASQETPARLEQHPSAHQEGTSDGDLDVCTSVKGTRQYEKTYWSGYENHQPSSNIDQHCFLVRVGSFLKLCSAPCPIRLDPRVVVAGRQIPHGFDNICLVALLRPVVFTDFLLEHLQLMKDGFKLDSHGTCGGLHFILPFRLRDIAVVGF